MKQFRSLFSLFGFYVLGLFSGTVVFGALFLYIGISWLHQPHRSDNENIRQLLQWGRIYAEELNQLEDLQAQTQASTSQEFVNPSVDLCTRACNPSPLSSDALLDEGAPYLLRFWQDHQNKALDDPYFFLAMGKIELLGQAYPRALRKSILTETSPSKMARIFRAFQLEWELTRHATNLAFNWDSIKRKWNSIETFQDSVLDCRKGEKPKKQVLTECQQGQL